ncbi:2'-5' RNA ligase family protein [Cryobacterium sp. BB307]|uniref:2'-5' RNA ligase family protein n=1 Tax=Cryobacterium sp. BB307 TaxID=2716317 RepID=UPI001444DFBA
MGRFVIILPLESLNVGDGFVTADWPLHVTVVPPFRTRCTAEQLREAMTAVARAREPLRITVGPDDWFGHRKDVLVSLVTDDGRIQKLHDNLLVTLRRCLVDHETLSHVGRGYRPHITATRHGRVTDGERYTLPQLALVDMATPHGDPPRVTRATVDLGGR